METKIVQGDCLEVLKTLEENSVDSVVTDPPYNLSTIKRFSAEDSGEKWCVKEGVFHRSSKGFMGKEWDNEIAFSPKVWQEIIRVLKPGGHLLSFGGTRTYHRMACAIEDAGFEIRDMIEWVYGSGFPKSLNIGKAVDKLQGNKRKSLGTTKGVGNNNTESMNSGVSKSSEFNHEYELTKGNSEWEGWGTALKPAHEPICMARKPLAEKTVAENVLKYGTGGINIDESRVKHNEPEWHTTRNPRKDDTTFSNKTCGFNSENTTLASANPQGRFPANLILSDSEEVRECFPETKTQGHWSKTKTTGFGEFGNGSSEYLGVGEKDKEGGNASRFFKSIIYQAKASKNERNKGCEGLEEKEEVYPGINTFDKNGNRLRADGSVIPPLKSKNNHPTVKPIALMSYLIKMITPKGGIVLDPFCGSGSTGVAAKENGFSFIGIEKEADYIKIAEARIKAVPSKLL